MPLDLVGAAEEMRRLEDLIEAGLRALKRYAAESAAAEATYRKAKAQAWVTTPRVRTIQVSGRSVEEKLTAFDRQAQVEGETADLRYLRDLARDMRQAALEAVRCRRAELSSWQSLLAAEKEEFGMARFGPHQGP